MVVRRRVPRVIQAQIGVDYSEGHVGTLFKELGCSPPKPRRRDNQQNPKPVCQWRAEQLPALKQNARRGTVISLFGLFPAISKTVKHLMNSSTKFN